MLVSMKKSVGCLAVLTLLLTSSFAHADRCRAVKLEHAGTLDDVKIDFRLIAEGQSVSSAESFAPAPEFKDGSNIDLCFTSNQSGLVSLWSYSADGSAPSRLLPHELTQIDMYEPGLQVEPGVEYCLSELLVEDKKIAIKVRPPFGTAQAYLHFAKEKDQQFGPEDFPVISDRSHKTPEKCDEKPHIRSEPISTYHSVEISYEVIQ